MNDKFRIVQVENKFYPQFRPWWWPFWFSMWEKSIILNGEDQDEKGYVKIYRDSIDKAKYCIEKYKAEEADFSKKRVKIIHSIE